MYANFDLVTRACCVLIVILVLSFEQNSTCCAQRFSQEIDKAADIEIRQAVKILRSIGTPFTKHRKHALGILKKHAPPDQTGIGIAHWEIANLELQKNHTGQEVDYSVVATHLRHCVSLEPTNARCVELYIKSLEQLGENDAAAKAYLEVYKRNPFKIHRLVALNKKLGRDEENPRLIANAWSQMEKSLGDEKFVDRFLSEEIQDLAALEPFLEDPEPAIKLIEIMIAKSARYAGATCGTSRTFNLMGRLISKQAANLADSNPEAIGERLELYRRALEYSSITPTAKIAITEIIIAGGENADLARAVYNPETDRRFPPPKAFKILADNAEKNGDPRSVVEHLDRIIRNRYSPEDMVQYCQASLKLDDDQANRALGRLRGNARSKKVLDIDLVKWRGLLFAKTGSHGQALDSLNAYLEEHPKDAQSLAAVKQCLEAIGRKSAEYRKKLSSGN